MTVLASPISRPAFLRRRHPLVAGLVFCALTGALLSLGDYAISEQRARGLTAAAGLQLVALDPEPLVRCPILTRGWTFVATREGHLIVGAACAGLNAHGSAVFTQTALR